ncbi:MAG: hypothetical protein IT379_17685 [Deltaproteobacteria bacterium]|nr:hypothetical protein [Deltaproteobacteria bacterium]
MLEEAAGLRVGGQTEVVVAREVEKPLAIDHGVGAWCVDPREGPFETGGLPGFEGIVDPFECHRRFVLLPTLLGTGREPGVTSAGREPGRRCFT